MTLTTTIPTAERYVLLAVLGIALLYALGTAPSHAAGHIPRLGGVAMTICPFMSRPVPEGVARDEVRGCVPDLYEVTCQREKCAAWGAVGRTLPGAAIDGCRLIGGEVPE